VTSGAAPAKLNLADAFARFTDRWSPKIAADLNEFHVKLVKLQGDFVGIATRRRTRCSSSSKAGF
jgi:hypothetical protein